MSVATDKQDDLKHNEKNFFFLTFPSLSHIFWRVQVTQHELDKKKITYISVTGAKTVQVFGIEAYCTRVSWTCDMAEIYYSCKCGQKIRGGGKKNWASEAVGWRKWVLGGLKSASADWKWAVEPEDKRYASLSLSWKPHAHKEACKFD